MRDDLKRAWDKAFETGEPVDIGGVVVCDFCSEDFTDSHETGGFLFGSKAVCPRCEPKMRESIGYYDEEHLIVAEAAKLEPFVHFVHRIRGGNNTIHVRKGRWW